MAAATRTTAVAGLASSKEQAGGRTGATRTGPRFRAATRTRSAGLHCGESDSERRQHLATARRRLYTTGAPVTYAGDGAPPPPARHATGAVSKWAWVTRAAGGLVPPLKEPVTPHLQGSNQHAPTTTHPPTPPTQFSILPARWMHGALLHPPHSPATTPSSPPPRVPLNAHFTFPPAPPTKTLNHIFPRLRRGAAPHSPTPSGSLAV